MLWGFAEPSTIGRRLQDANVPIAPDVLKLDIDSIDLPILRSVFAAGFRPKVLMAEINPDIPPPVHRSRLEPWLPAKLRDN